MINYHKRNRNLCLRHKKIKNTQTNIHIQSGRRATCVTQIQTSQLHLQKILTHVKTKVMQEYYNTVSVSFLKMENIIYIFYIITIKDTALKM